MVGRSLGGWGVRLAFSGTRRRDQAAIIPLRLVDHLHMVQLPAGQVDPPSPELDDVASEAISRDDVVSDASIAQRINQAALEGYPSPGAQSR